MTIRRNATAALVLFTLLPQEALAQKGASTPLPIKTKVIASDSCIITAKPSTEVPILAPLLGILVPIIVETLIDAVTKELKKVEVKKSAGSVGWNLYALPVSPGKGATLVHPGCLTIVTGRFKKAEGLYRPKDDIKTGTAVPPDATAAQLAARLKDNGIDTGADLLSVFEVKIDSSGDATAFRYTPVYYRLLALLPGQGSKPQGVAYALSHLGPGATPNGSALTSAAISLGEVSAPLELSVNSTSDQKQVDRLAALQTGWISMPELSTPSYRAMQRARAAGNGGAFMPVVLQAELAQTKKPSDLAVFVAGLLGGAKAKIVEAATDNLVPKDPETVATALADAKIAVTTAEVELATALALPATDTARDAKIRLAQLKLDKARAALAAL